MFTPIQCTYNIKEPICQWSLFVLLLEAAHGSLPATSEVPGNGERR